MFLSFNFKILGMTGKVDGRTFSLDMDSALSGARFQKEAKELMNRFDTDKNKSLDREEFRKILKELDHDHIDPLPANFE